VTVNSGGSITGGTLGGVGTFTAGSLTFNGGTYKADFSGTTSDTITTGGPVNLNGGTAGTFAVNSTAGTATTGTVFTLINNTAAGAIANPPLTGAAEGSSTTVNGQTSYFTYAGGDGNNFTLTAGGGTSFGPASGNLEVRIVNPSPGQTDLQLLQNGVVVDSRPLGTVTGTYTITGDSSTQSLLVNY